MRALSTPFRKQLESAVLAGRRASEAAARAAIEALDVFADRRPEHLDDEQAALRNGLRAKWRQLGGDRGLLVSECAYEQWHRLLFARFLAENRLLLHPLYRAPVTLEECEELAEELGEPDGWSVAGRFAAEILPGIFRLDDPCVRLRLAPEGRHALEQVVSALPAEVFAADDALGWVYQFWQKDKKDEVNASERKIGGADLGPVTQLFTENYMVRFLLENSLGAWWASRHPESLLVAGFEYLRFDEDGKPAAGSFDGWPESAAEVTVMDPCCGSGHFLVEAFSMLWQMRVEEEGLDPVAAQDAVLCDNLFGLELDPRCVQIAMFAVAQQAWKSGGGWRELPVPNIACSGIPVKTPVEEWKKLARGDERLENALERLHVLFQDADTLGSLIDPRREIEVSELKGQQRSLDDADWAEVAPLLRSAAASESADPAVAVLGMDAASIAAAASHLSRSFTLVVTNVPYLGRRHQVRELQDFCDSRYGFSRADLATVFIERLLELAEFQGSIGCVAPQNWLTLGSYKALRVKLLATEEWRFVALLGSGAFGSISGEVVNVGLFVLSHGVPSSFAGVRADDVRDLGGKMQALQAGQLVRYEQSGQLEHPDSRIVLARLGSGPLLEAHGHVFKGLTTGDDPKLRRKFWELSEESLEWRRLQRSARSPGAWDGCDSLVWWYEMVDPIRPGVELRAEAVWGTSGVAITQSSALPANLYSGERFDQTVAVFVPNLVENLAPVLAFCSSPDYSTAVRALDKKPIVTAATLAKVPFDLEHWRRVAQEAGPLPGASSDDPAQWLFGGRPEESTEPLQVAVGRLLGYRWPEQSGSDDLDALPDADGTACLPSVAGEPSAVERLQELLALAFGHAWSPAKAKDMLDRAGSKKKNLADWLRDEFFKQHCALFAKRPFIWHIWDGQHDGFSALVNYHRLNGKTLEKLTYTYLGQDWVERQRAGVRDEIAGAEDRLAAALDLQGKLQSILTGETPYDIYVRWKDLHEQPVGWEPALNDGVRLNIRPFVEAGVLRVPFNMHWKKDRGKNPDGSERLNDIHLSLAEKLEARRVAGERDRDGSS